MERDPSLRFSISYTTRPQRPTEVHGRDYYFVSRDEFQRMVARGRFLEHAQVFDNYYGTPRRQVEESLARGRGPDPGDRLAGCAQVRRALPECTSIFILPPSRAALEQRLRSRGTDTDEVIARRLQDAVADMTHWREFHYVIVNDDFDHALVDLKKIIAGQGQTLRSDRPELKAITAALLA